MFTPKSSQPIKMNKITLLIIVICIQNTIFSQSLDEIIVSYTVDSKQEKIKLYLKDSLGNPISNASNLLKFEDSLVLVMNAGMYKIDQSPQGLYIQESKLIQRTNKVQNAYGNFYMQPNGVFYIQNDTPKIIQTSVLKLDSNISYATQSGPMLVVDGKKHLKFMEGSKNLNIRNGVGILPNGNVLFAISKEKINFYDFATFFQNKGCKNALYLDGFVSRAYIPSKNWIQLDGRFGVLIGVIKK
jgi:uncharacterized protein YigE (DUF2233 family)